MFKSTFRHIATAAFIFTAACFVQASAFAVDHIARGKEMLFNQNDVVGARAEFGQALNNSEYDQQVANFWCAVTEIAQNDALRAKLRELKIFGVDDKPAVFDAEGEPNYNAQADVDNIIVDDDAVVYQDLATWEVLQEPDDLESCYNESAYSHARGTGANTATWTPTVITGGFYKVYIWVAASDLNTVRAKYTIVYPGGSATTYVNQKSGGWVGLGNFYFPAGNVTSIILSDETSQGRVIADAIKLEYRGTIVDDSDPAFQTSGGGWQSVTGANGPVNGTYRWHEADASESATATWTFNVPDTSKEYLVYVTIPQIATGAATTLEYTLSAAGGPVNIKVGYEQNSLHVVCLGLFRFSSATGNTLTLKSSASGKVSADSMRIDPARPYPDLTEGQGLASGPSGAEGMLTQIDAALGRLSNIDDTAKDFTDTVTVDNQTYTLDYGEAQMIESALRTWKAIIKINAAYEMANAEIQPILFNEGVLLGTPLSFLESYPALLTLRSGSGTLLEDARAALVSAIDAYYPAADFILNRNDQDGILHLLDFHYPYPNRDEYGPDDEYAEAVAEWERERDAALEIEGFMRGKGTEIRNNLTNHASQPFVTIPELPAGVEEDDMDIDINVDVDFAEFFSSPKDMHSYLSTFLALSVIYDNTADIDLGGILPYIKPEDWNYLFGVGPRFKDDPLVIWAEDGTPSVKLEWDIAQDEYASSIVKYEIYRATSLDMSDAVLVDTITDKAVTTYTDTSLGGAEDVYYYRIHTYYDFGGGHTARTYTQAGKAILRIYVDSNASSDGNGSKTFPYKNLGYATSEGAGNGTKVCVAAGTYYENTNSLRLWRRSSLVMEGGYNAVAWTRDIVSNETILDSTGPNNWSCINLWAKTFVIDGFTLKGAKAYWDSPAIEASNTDLIVRNCKIRDSNSGIRIRDCTRALIENCDMEGAITSGTRGIQVHRDETAIPLSSVIIRNCSVAKYSSGVGIANWRGATLTITIFNNLIIDNKEDGIYLGSSSGTSAVVINNTIANNRGPQGIGYGSFVDSVNIKNNIIINNNGWGYGIYGDNVSGPTRVITNNDSYGNTGGNYYRCGTSAGQNGNISLDPLFVTGPKGPYYLSQTAAGQPATSPCVDAGSDTAANLELANTTTRSDGMADTGMVDMGYHYIAPTLVTGRRVFYNNSAFDGRDASANELDDNAIAPDKQALLPGGTAAFTNYTSYSRGINGIMVDVQNLPNPANLTLETISSYFQFKAGNNNFPETWQNAPSPSLVAVREITPSTHRITLIWPDGIVKKQWLEIKALSNSHTGLSQPDTFYFGNAVAECGNSPTDTLVNSVDMLEARNNTATFINPAPKTNPYDYNRDRRINATDVLIARNNQTNAFTALKLITFAKGAVTHVKPRRVPVAKPVAI